MFTNRLRYPRPCVEQAQLRAERMDPALRTARLKSEYNNKLKHERAAFRQSYREVIA